MLTVRSALLSVAVLTAFVFTGCVAKPNQGPAVNVSPETASLTVSSSLLPVRVAVSPEFRFIGRQQFILRDKVQVEQHVFVKASATKDVEQLVWIQYERFLPGVEGHYSYDRTEVITLGGLEFDVNVRQYLKSPEVGSDRQRAYELLESRGLRFASPATRVRLVHVPVDDQRSEIMIVHAERDATAADLGANQRARRIARATEIISVHAP